MSLKSFNAMPPMASVDRAIVHLTLKYKDDKQMWNINALEMLYEWFSDEMSREIYEFVSVVNDEYGKNMKFGHSEEMEADGFIITATKITTRTYMVDVMRDDPVVKTEDAEDPK